MRGIAINRACSSRSAQGKSFTTAPLNVANERDIYTIDVEGFEPDAMKTALSKLGGEIAPALKRIAKGGALSGQDQELVLTLMALLAVKNPGQRVHHRGVSEEIAKKLMSMSLIDREHWEAEVAAMRAAGVELKEDSFDYEGMRAFVEIGE